MVDEWYDTIFEASGTTFSARSLHNDNYLWYQLHNGHNFSTTRPMKAMSSVLEGPHRALSIRRIASLIGRLLIQSTRLKTGLESDQLGKIWRCSQIFKAEVKTIKMNDMTTNRKLSSRWFD